MSDAHSGSPSGRAYRCMCGAAIFFRNSQCLSCGRALAYEPSSGRMVCLLAAQGKGPGSSSAWRIEGDTDGALLHRCANHDKAAACNWLLPSESHPDHSHGLCLACSLNRTIPDQSLADNQLLWAKIEVAKRRLVRQLIELGLPVRSKLSGLAHDAEHGLAFDFLRQWPGQLVTTGHANGVITVNVLEADDAFREHTRTALGEPYRTLLGHLRHEVGHYFWSRLIARSPWIDAFRLHFGDERQNYEAALQRHYQIGACSDWQKYYVSSYASCHPWEDWAETWAHYLHMRDALQTAQCFALAASAMPSDGPAPHACRTQKPQPEDKQSFLRTVNQWLALSGALNEMSDSLGQQPLYPFVLTSPVVSKLQFVHEVVVREGSQRAIESQPA